MKCCEHQPAAIGHIPHTVRPCTVVQRQASVVWPAVKPPQPNTFRAVRRPAGRSDSMNQKNGSWHSDSAVTSAGQ